MQNVKIGTPQFGYLLIDLSKNCEKGARHNVGFDQTVFVICCRVLVTCFFFTVIYLKKKKNTTNNK